MGEANFTAALVREIDFASQGETENEAFANLQEALELRFQAPVERPTCRK